MSSEFSGIIRRAATLCSRLLTHRLDLEVVGLEHVPVSGPAVIACRHFHHLWDGVILLSVCPRFTYLLVALDWVRNRWERFFLELGCRLLGWPAILRPNSPLLTGRHGFHAGETRRYLRRGVGHVVRLLRAGELVVIFPEAYPNVDPIFTPKQDSGTFLRFRPGLVRLIDTAQRDGRTQVAIIPAGLQYRRDRTWHVSLRFGEPLFLRADDDRASLLQAVEDRVRALSGLC